MNFVPAQAPQFRTSKLQSGLTLASKASESPVRSVYSEFCESGLLFRPFSRQFLASNFGFIGTILWCDDWTGGWHLGDDQGGLSG